VDSDAADAEALGSFGDGELFCHAFLYHKRLCREWHGSMDPDCLALALATAWTP
jgi:hypothetical protein